MGYTIHIYCEKAGKSTMLTKYSDTWGSRAGMALYSGDPALLHAESPTSIRALSK